MSGGSPLDRWRFLVGEWKGISSQPDEYGEEGIIEGSHVFTEELDGAFIMGRHDAWQGDRTVNKSISLLYYDSDNDLFRRKYAFSYGFVNNEVEIHRDEDVIKFETSIEPFPEYFRGTKWRSFVRKISEDEVHLGLEVSRDGGEFETFGTTVLKRE